MGASAGGRRGARSGPVSSQGLGGERASWSTSASGPVAQWLLGRTVTTGHALHCTSPIVDALPPGPFFRKNAPSSCRPVPGWRVGGSDAFETAQRKLRKLRKLRKQRIQGEDGPFPPRQRTTARNSTRPRSLESTRRRPRASLALTGSPLAAPLAPERELARRRPDGEDFSAPSLCAAPPDIGTLGLRNRRSSSPRASRPASRRLAITQSHSGRSAAAGRAWLECGLRHTWSARRRLPSNLAIAPSRAPRLCPKATTPPRQPAVTASATRAISMAVAR